jgi:hypothetical protein
MFGRTWTHDVLRKYIILFGTVFNDIYIQRDDSNGEIIQTLKIPLTYGPREKVLARLEGDAELDRQIAILVPRITFEMTTFEYDPTRKLNTLNKLTKQNANAGTDDEILYQYQPVPYDINFTMSILVKNAEDGTRIIEQILPYFTPEWTASVNLVPEVDGPRDIPIILNDVSVEDSYEGDFTQRRAIIWTLNFTMKAWLYGPSKKSGLIKFAKTTFRLTDDVDTATTSNTANTVVVSSQPGLTANGTATSNSSATIDYSEIKSTDDYGYINTITENI